MKQTNGVNRADITFWIFTFLIVAAWWSVFKGGNTSGDMTLLALVGTVLWFIVGLATQGWFRWIFGVVLVLIILVKCWVPIVLFLIWPPLFWIWVGSRLGNDHK